MGPLTSSSVTTDPSLLLKIVKAICWMFGNIVTGSHALVLKNLLYQCHSQLLHQKYKNVCFTLEIALAFNSTKHIESKERGQDNITHLSSTTSWAWNRPTESY